MLLFKFFLAFFFFFFYGKQIATPSHEAEWQKPRPDGRSWLSALRGCHQKDALLTPETAGLAQRGSRDIPHQPGVCEQGRGLLSLKASLH